MIRLGSVNMNSQIMRQKILQLRSWRRRGPDFKAQRQKAVELKLMQLFQMERIEYYVQIMPCHLVFMKFGKV